MRGRPDVRFRGVLGSPFSPAQAGFAVAVGRCVNSKSIGLSVDRCICGVREYIVRVLPPSKPSNSVLVVENSVEVGCRWWAESKEVPEKEKVGGQVHRRPHDANA